MRWRSCIYYDVAAHSRHSPSPLRRTLFLLVTLIAFIQNGLCFPPNREKAEEVVQLEAPRQAAKKQPEMAKRPDHLEAVPLERDGQLNKEFRREVFLGKDTSDVSVDGQGNVIRKDETKNKETATLIREMFKIADKNGDEKLNFDELESRIVENTIHHLDEAQAEARSLLNIFDQNGDGHISWDEYHYHFLVDNNIMNPNKAKDHDEKEHATLNEDTRYTMEDDKIAFQKADPDKNGLDEIEWLSFRHPEHSAIMLRDMAEDILKALDTDKDGELTEDEFSAPAPGEVDKKFLEAEKQFIEDRRKEFKEAIDTDKNGRATLDELISFVNPRNPMHAKQEVHEIMSIADDNEDGLLTLDELLKYKDQLESSGFIRPQARLHEDL